MEVDYRERTLKGFPQLNECQLVTVYCKDATASSIGIADSKALAGVGKLTTWLQHTSHKLYNFILRQRAEEKATAM